MDAVHALSPLDGRYKNQAAPLTPFFSEAALIKYRLRIEIEWFIFMAENSIMPKDSLNSAHIQHLHSLWQNFSTNDAAHIKTIEKTTNHDVKAVEYFLKEKTERMIPSSCQSFWHFGCTSEDINNLAYALMLKEALFTVILPELQAIQTSLHQKAQAYASLPMLAHTHGQTASPTTLGKEFANFAYRLKRQLTQLEKNEILGKFQGAVGNFNAHMIACPSLSWPRLAEKFVTHLGLVYNPLVTQIEPHDFIAELSHTLIRIHTILLDFTRDIWTYISLDYFKLKVIAGEVGSSTMPHKVNPIDFENSEGNLGLANALFGHFAEKLPISRLQRDLTDSTVLRNLGVAFGYGLIAYCSLLKGLAKVNPNEEQMEQALASRYEVLTEALQTVLRYHGVPDAYEQLKTASRGRAFTRETYLACIETLDLPPVLKTDLKNLTPKTYLGLAKELALLVI